MNGYRIVEVDVAEVRIGKGYRVGLVGKREINLFAPEQRAYNANIFPKFRDLGRRVSEHTHRRITGSNADEAAPGSEPIDCRYSICCDRREA